MDIQHVASQTVDFIFFILPFFAAWALISHAWSHWIDYIEDKFDASVAYVILRIYPPQEVLKTPLSMELFLNALHQTGGESTWYDKKVLGKSRAVFTLEMVSHGGEVAFYIRTKKGLRREVEAQLYAQYPGIEVVEAEDYAADFDLDSGKYSMYGCEYKLAKPDPWPIKTYVDYGLDKISEEEEKSDPITTVIEFLGSLKPGEHLWLQIFVKAHKKEDKKPGTFFDVQDNWQEEAKEIIKEIRENTIIEREDGTVSLPNPTKGQTDQINAIERSVAKPGFDCGIRGIYLAEKDVFDGTTIGALRGVFRPFSSESLNTLKPSHDTGTDFPWQNWWGATERLQRWMLKDYKNRDYFDTTRNAVNFFGFTGNVLGFPNKKDRVKFVLNAEELATIFHFPGTVAGTPSFNRVKSRKGEPPADLPV